MKEVKIKSYYAEDKLNKGYSQDHLEKEAVKPLLSELPPLEVISEYEEIYPGTLKKLMDLVESEQKTRVELEKMTIDAHHRSRRLGVLTGIISLSIICSATVTLAKHNLNTAIIFAALSFAAIFGISLVASLRQQRRPHNGHNRWRADSNSSNKNSNASGPSSSNSAGKEGGGRKFYRRNRGRY